MTVSEKQFTTKHAIILGTIFMTAWLLWSGMSQPDGFVMSLASSGTEHAILRFIILVSLIAILFSRPPRSMPLRLLLGAVSSLTLLVACASMIDYHIGILDAVIYLEVSIILAIEAIEAQTVPVEFTHTTATSS